MSNEDTLPGQGGPVALEEAGEGAPVGPLLSTLGQSGRGDEAAGCPVFPAFEGREKVGQQIYENSEDSMKQPEIDYWIACMLETYDHVSDLSAHRAADRAPHRSSSSAKERGFYGRIRSASSSFQFTPPP